MDNKIVKTGLGCKVNAKLMLMRCFLSNAETRRLVVEKMKELGGGELTVPEERQEQLMREFGVRIHSVTRLDDEGLERVYDALEREGRIERWLNDQVPHMKERALAVLGWDHEEVNVDVTGFLVYGIVKNDRCRKLLMDYMEEQREACYQAYRESVYADGLMIRRFPQQQMLAAMLCIGLLERIRTEHEDTAAYEALISIISGGYKRVRTCVKQRDGIGGKEFQEILAEMDSDKGEDALYFLAAGVVGLVLAEDMRIPVRMDFLMLSFLPVLQEWGEVFLEEQEQEETDGEELECCVREIEEQLEALRQEQIRLRLEQTRLRREVAMLAERIRELEQEDAESRGKSEGLLVLCVHELQIPSIPIDIARLWDYN